MLSVFFPNSIFKRNAKMVSQLYQDISRHSSSELKAIAIPKYAGSHPQILLMKKEIAEISQYLKLAVVHGSYATGEEIAYSDFDGLIVISDSAISNPEILSEVAFRLHQIRRYMHRIDPFQHHGWFVLSEKELYNYPEWFLPTAVLKYCKSLLADVVIDIRIQEKPDVDFRKSFTRICESVIKKLSSAKSDWNLYQLKSIFSEFMMLPSAYVQARDDKGIFKKYSFDEMRKDFSTQEFKVMDEVSSIRANWVVEVNGADRKLLERLDFLSWKKRQRMKMTIPIFIESFLNDGLFERMNEFALLSKFKIQEGQSQ